MKGKLTAIALLAAAVTSSAVMADDGKVNFVGNIIEQGCEVNSTINSPLEVKLGDVAKTALAGTGTTAANTKFTLVLKNCPDDLKGKPVVVKYDGAADTVNPDTLQLTGYGDTGVAKGVAIQLANESGEALPLGLSSDEKTISATGETNLNFFARYIATEDTVTAGTANGTVNFTLSYN
ncbi:fimbrial protein [Superficieibacter sp. BNK-5]|uniref:fimbrial protein n=1 Tax=Superficieibacter sp. BNK-5 TaxID=3376142 RepID=UPI0039BFE6FC